VLLLALDDLVVAMVESHVAGLGAVGAGLQAVLVRLVELTALLVLLVGVRGQGSQPDRSDAQRTQPFASIHECLLA